MHCRWGWPCDGSLDENTSFVLKQAFHFEQFLIEYVFPGEITRVGFRYQKPCYQFISLNPSTRARSVRNEELHSSICQFREAPSVRNREEAAAEISSTLGKKYDHYSFSTLCLRDSFTSIRLSVNLNHIAKNLSNTSNINDGIQIERRTHAYTLHS